MNPILAQIDIEWWHVVTGAIVLIGASAVKWWLSISSERAKEKREERRDNEHTTFLSRIAASNEAAATAIATLNEKLSAQEELQKIRHGQNLDRMNLMCRYRRPGQEPERT